MDTPDIISPDDIEVNVIWEHESSTICWRWKNRPADMDEWISSPFQRADVITEEDARRLIANWID